MKLFFSLISLAYSLNVCAAFPQDDTLITWTSLSGEWQEQPDGYVIVVDWTTLSERQAEFFEVERSIDGTTFQSIGILNASGNSNSEKVYQFADHFPDTLSIVYRIKSIHTSGEIRFSEMIPVTGTVKSALEASAVQDYVTQSIDVQLSLPQQESVTVDLISLEGESVTTVQQGNLGKGLHHFTLNTAFLNCGMYYLRVSGEYVTRFVPLLYP